MTFTAKEIETPETLAEILKKLRREAKKSLGEVAEAIKIQKKHLRGLEAGDYDKLPADIYVRGYLRAYGRLLKTDPESLVKIFQRERLILKNLKQRETFKKKPTLRYPRFVITPRLLAWFLVILALLSVSLYFWYELDLFKGLPQIVLISPLKNLETDQDFILFSGRVSKEANLLLNGEPIWINEESVFEELVPLQEGLNTIYLVAANKLGKKQVVTRYIIKY